MVKRQKIIVSAKRVFALTVLLAFLTVMIPINSEAYVKTGYKFSKPGSIKYLVASSAQPYLKIINNTFPTWGSYVGRVSLSRTESESSANIRIYYTEGSGSRFATTDRQDKSGNYYKIYLHKPWANLSSTNQKKEVILHEVGHALGLDHTQTTNYSKSIMWDGADGLRFHNVAYPLSDDINGVNSIYHSGK